MPTDPDRLAAVLTAYGDPTTSHAIRERALDRAGRYPHLTGDELTARMLARGSANAADRAAARARLTAHDARADADNARKNRAEALRWLRTDFTDHADADLTDPDVAAWTLAALDGDPTWLVLLGPVGVGKTWQACAAYRAVVEHLACDGYATRGPALLRRTMPGAPDPLNWQRLEDVDLLLIDDVPGALSDYEQRTLLQILDTRQARRRRTIITTNLAPAQVAEQLGERIASRLSAGTRAVVLTGHDRRRAQATR